MHRVVYQSAQLADTQWFNGTFYLPLNTFQNVYLRQTLFSEMHLSFAGTCSNVSVIVMHWFKTINHQRGKEVNNVNQQVDKLNCLSNIKHDLWNQT